MTTQILGNIDTVVDLRNISTLREYEPNSVIVFENDNSNQIYFIQSGRVEVCKLSPGGKEIWFAELGAGCMFGGVSALTGHKRFSTVTSLEQTQVAILKRDDLVGLMRLNPEFSVYLLENLAERVENIACIAIDVMSKTIAQRIRSELCRLMKPCPYRPSVLTINPLPRSSILARRLNTDRENISREISSLVKKGVLEKTKTELLVLDKSYLEI